MTEAGFASMLADVDPGLMEVRVRSDKAALCWIPCASPRALMRMLTADDCEIGAVPRTEPDSWSLGESHVLWARLETGASEQLLQRFRPSPTLVLREGQTFRRWALWALSRPLSGSWTTKANERLAYALHARRKSGDASTLIRSPFTRITYGRRSPIPCWVEFETPEIYTPRELVGRLRDAPEIRWDRAA
jgi:hypothetical protein